MEFVVASINNGGLIAADVLNNVLVQFSRLVLKILVRVSALQLQQTAVLLPRQGVADNGNAQLFGQIAKTGWIVLFELALAGRLVEWMPFVGLVGIRIVDIVFETSQMFGRGNVGRLFKDFGLPLALDDLRTGAEREITGWRAGRRLICRVGLLGRRGSVAAIIVDARRIRA